MDEVAGLRFNHRVLTAVVRACLTLALLSVWPATAAAQPQSGWHEEPESRVRLIAAQDAVGDGQMLRIAVEMELAEGWKTYWRQPGETGIPPRFDWSGSANVANVQLAWPAPERFDAFGFSNVGYAGDVAFPVKIAAEHAGRALAVRLVLDYAACAEICLPVRAELALELPPGPARASGHAAMIAEAERRVPVREDGPFQVRAAHLADASVELEIVSEVELSAPDVMLEGGPGVSFGAPERRLSANRRIATFSVPFDPGLGEARLREQPITVTIVDGEAAVERRVELR